MKLRHLFFACSGVFVMMFSLLLLVVIVFSDEEDGGSGGKTNTNNRDLRRTPSCRRVFPFHVPMPAHGFVPGYRAIIRLHRRVQDGR